MKSGVVRALIAACLVAGQADRALAWGEGGYWNLRSRLWGSPPAYAPARGGDFARRDVVDPNPGGFNSTIDVPIYATASSGGYSLLTAAEATAHPTLYFDPDSLARAAAAVRKAFAHMQVFTPAWWRTQPKAWRPMGWKVPDAWVWATDADLRAWLGIDAAPIYFDYGHTIVYQGDDVHSGYDGPVLATAAQYYQQAADLALSGGPTTDNGNDWKALGVYALVLDDSTKASQVLQLAVARGGLIRGNCFQPSTGTTLDVRGAVDTKTQRAAWVVGDNKSTVYDTGLVNLTMDCAPGLIHSGKERTQQWLLVRLRETDIQPVVVAKVEPAPAPAANEAPATVILLVPADAEIWFDGVATSQEGTKRTFPTPPLAKGTRYRYTVRARWTEGGKPVDESQNVIVQAGEQVRVRFPKPAATD